MTDHGLFVLSYGSFADDTKPRTDDRNDSPGIQESSPFKKDDDFVFYSADGSKPYTNNRGILDSFYDALKAIEISENERKERNLVFHSLRHSASTSMRFGGMPDFLIQAYIGHSSTAMTDPYPHIRDEDSLPIIGAQGRCASRYSRLGHHHPQVTVLLSLTTQAAYCHPDFSPHTCG
ncbi:MAG: tyrosine-type recombinase/integrase [Spirochaetota bacterium]